MKGIILAGGVGSRLHPVTTGISKQLIPVYDKPMIYYPLSTLMLAGIRDIMIITTAGHRADFEHLLGDGRSLGCHFRYAVQEQPEGVAQAFSIAEEFIGSDKVALILGDNLFFGSGFGQLLRQCTGVDGALIFAAQVNDPQRYGVVEFDDRGRVVSLEEKPEQPKSRFAIPGLYFYDNSVLEISRGIQRSSRGEFEITDVNRRFLERGQLQVCTFNRGIAWLDTGTFTALHEASTFVRVIEERQNTRIGCIEEVAYYMRYIDEEQLAKLADQCCNSPYGEYLRQVAGLPRLDTQHPFPSTS